MAWTEKYVAADAAGGGDGSVGTPWTLAEALSGVAAVVAGGTGCRVNVKVGTYANTTTSRDFSAAGTTTAPIWWRGYKTTIGDQDTNNAAIAGTDIPLITFTTGQLTVSAAYQLFSNLAFTSQCTTSNGALNINAWVRMYRCRFATSVNQYVMTLRSSAPRSHIVACHFSSTGTNSLLQLAGVGCQIDSCYFGGGGSGIFVNANDCSINDCIFDNNGASGVYVDYACSIRNCSFYSPVSHAINIHAGVPVLAINNYFEDVNQTSTGAIYNTTGGDIINPGLVSNGYFNCTANYVGITENAVIWDQGTLASAAFTNPASDDFTIGAVAQQLGFPGAFEGLGISGHVSLGAVQPVVSGNTTNLIIHAG